MGKWLSPDEDPPAELEEKEPDEVEGDEPIEVDELEVIAVEDEELAADDELDEDDKSDKEKKIDDNHYTQIHVFWGFLYIIHDFIFIHFCMKIHVFT